MDIKVEYRSQLKISDTGDIFKISFIENGLPADPPEFTFDENTTCKFIAKHKTLTKSFIGDCIINISEKSAVYKTDTADITQLGGYDFEFEFHSGEIIQTFPKNTFLSFTAIDDLN